MDEAGLLAETVGDGAEEGVEVVVHLALVLGGASGVIAGASDLLHRLGGDDTALGPGLADGDLDAEPGVELVLVRPDAGHFGASVAGDHEGGNREQGTGGREQGTGVG